MIDQLKPLIGKLTLFAKDRMGFAHPPRLFLRSDSENSQKMLGKTAYYDPQEKAITLFTHNRHPKDILRSYAHELVHHTQNLRGDLSSEKCGEMSQGYAQENEHMREMEREAYEEGNMCFRDWEDTLSNKDAYIIIKLNESLFLKENKKMNKQKLTELIRDVVRSKLNEKKNSNEITSSKEASAAMEKIKALNSDIETFMTARDSLQPQDQRDWDAFFAGQMPDRFPNLERPSEDDFRNIVARLEPRNDIWPMISQIVRQGREVSALTKALETYQSDIAGDRGENMAFGGDIEAAGMVGTAYAKKGDTWDKRFTPDNDAQKALQRYAFKKPGTYKPADGRLAYQNLDAGTIYDRWDGQGNKIPKAAADAAKREIDNVQAKFDAADTPSIPPQDGTPDPEQGISGVAPSAGDTTTGGDVGDPEATAEPATTTTPAGAGGVSNARVRRRAASQERLLKRMKPFMMEKISDLQRTLMYLGYLAPTQANGQPSDDGKYGRQTMNAVIELQKAAGMPRRMRDGVLGNDTIRFIKPKSELFKKLKASEQEAKLVGLPGQTDDAGDLGKLFPDVSQSTGLEEKKAARKKAKPDYIDIDGDNNRRESMKKAAADKKKKKKKNTNETKIQTPEQENSLYESRFNNRNNRLFENLVKKWTK